MLVFVVVISLQVRSCLKNTLHVNALDNSHLTHYKPLHVKTKVCVVEKDWLGGAGVWNGALSSKTQWQLSRRARGFAELLKSTKSGLNYEGNYEEVSCSASAFIHKN